MSLGCLSTQICFGNWMRFLALLPMDLRIKSLENGKALIIVTESVEMTPVWPGR